jgi:aminoglycoside phosphotransferase (APT) family kinase protein
MTDNDEFLAYLLRRLDLAGKANASKLELLSHSHFFSALKLTAGDTRYMVRRGGHPDGIRDLRREFNVLTLLDGSGLAPSPVMFDQDRNFIVYEYLPGVIWSRRMLTEAGALEALTDSLARLHSNNPPGSVCDPIKTVELYLLNADTALRSRLMEIANGAMGRLHGTRSVLCHYDMWCGNIIQDRNTRFIDWEFANGGAPLIDLATLVCYHSLDEDETEALWCSYAGKTQEQLHREDLATWCIIVDCLTVAWCGFSMALGDSPGATEPFYGPAAKRLGLNINIQDEKPSR